MSEAQPHLWSPNRQPEPPETSPARPSNPLAFERCTSPPPMRRVNGIGVILLGRVTDAAIDPARVKLLWLTILFVPVLPIRAYAVTGGSGGYYFHGEMGLWRFLRRYRWRVFPYLLTVIVESVLRAAVLIAVLLGAVFLVAWLFGRL